VSEHFVVPHLKERGIPLYNRVVAEARGIEGVLNLLGGDPDLDAETHQGGGY